MPKVKLVMEKDESGKFVGREKKLKDKKPKGRPKKRKDQPPMDVTKEVAETILSERAQNGRAMEKGFRDADGYAYFEMAFRALKAEYEGKVPNYHPPQGEGTFRRYTPRKMFENLCKFVEFTLQAKQPLTITGMGLFMGIRRKDMFRVLHTRVLHKSYHFIYDFASFCEMYCEFSAQKRQNPAGPIFILKNFGWVDKIEIEATSIEGAFTEVERKEAQKRISNFSE